MKLKRILTLMLVMTSMISCKYDDSELKESIDSLENRISALETTVKQMNADITSMQTIISSLEKNVYVEKVEKQENGYVIFFTDETKVIINNGKDGEDGEKGENGKDGKDAPVIGIALESGRYYWTMTLDGKTTWLEDADGHKLSVTDNGDSIPGVTPLLKVDSEGYWIVSYDKGEIYSRILDEGGNPISAVGEKGDKGDKGDTGLTGPAGDSSFGNVTETADEIIFTLPNNTVITIPKVKAFGITFSQAKDILIGTTGAKLDYTITGADNDTFVKAYANGNLKVKVTMTSPQKGIIEVEATGEITAESEVIVLLCNKDKTITTILTFIKEVVKGGNENFKTEEGTWD